MKDEQRVIIFKFYSFIYLFVRQGHLLIRKRPNHESKKEKKKKKISDNKKFVMW